VPGAIALAALLAGATILVIRRRARSDA
jgi:nitrate reductase gamma subunit